MPNLITSVQDLPSREPMLAWVEYPSYPSKNCYVYPQLTKVGNEFSVIESSAFPD